VTAQPFNRYPDPHQTALKQRIAAIKNVSAKQLFLGNGSDEAIDLLIRATCTPRQNKVILLPPTYGMYEVSAAINDVPTVRVPLTPSFQINFPAVMAAIDSHPEAKLLFLCSPNNPSGNLLNADHIHQLIQTFPGIVVVDEAYIDFAGQPSFTTQLENYPNLVVLQTFSKVWGLANLRLGMAFASPAIIGIMDKIKPPYNISGLTQQIVLDGLQDVRWKDEMVESLLIRRQELAGLLQNIPFVEAIHPSDANFLLVKVRDAKQAYRHLVGRQIIVRDRSGVMLCENCLRITVGTSSENIRLAEALQFVHSAAL